MSVDREKFQLASEAAESWLNTASLVADYGKFGSVDVAYELLCGLPGNLEDSFSTHARVLHEAFDELGAQSDAPVMWESGRGWSGICAGPGIYPHVWSSAHEAAHGIAMLFLRALVWPLAVKSIDAKGKSVPFTDADEQRAAAERLLTTRWKALAISLTEVAVLQERIRRERAKLFAQPDPYLPGERPAQCAKRINCHLDTLKRYIDKGIVRCVKVPDSKLWRLHKDDVRNVGGKID